MGLKSVVSSRVLYRLFLERRKEGKMDPDKEKRVVGLKRKKIRSLTPFLFVYSFCFKGNNFYCPFPILTRDNV